MIQHSFADFQFTRPLFSDRVALAWADPRAPMPPLMGDEVLSVEQVAPKRAREFGAGRAAARAAMDLLGHAARPILQGDDRAPVWPQGLVGSITHSDRDCLAVVTDDPEIRSLGLDLEPMVALDPALWPEICTDTEREWLASLGPSQRGNFAKLVFSAKEAVYKAQYPLSKTLIGFHAITLNFDLASNSFTARFTRDVPGFDARHLIDGRFAFLSGNLITGVELR